MRRLKEDPEPGFPYVQTRLGLADDHASADGITVLSYAQAVKMATVGQVKNRAADSYTVAEAIEDYLSDYETRGRSIGKHRAKFKKVSDKLLRTRVSALSRDALRRWHHSLIKTDGDDEAKRKRKSTANKHLSALKAALNFAYREGMTKSDVAWRAVKPFHGVDAPRVRFLVKAEAKRLINACEPDFRQMVRAALLTGCRYGELCRLTVGDYNADAGTVYIRTSKSGKPRDVFLSEEGRRFFNAQTAGRPNKERVFVRGDGEPWGEAHQVRRMKDACTKANIDPPVGFHILRHTFASFLAQDGVPLQVIAQAIGDSDTRIVEKHYAHLQPSQVAAAVQNSLPDFGFSSNVQSIR
mgnify:FL=1